MERAIFIITGLINLTESDVPTKPERRVVLFGREVVLKKTFIPVYLYGI